MKYKATIYQELEIPNVSNTEEASNVVIHTVQDQLESQSLRDVFNIKYEEVIEYFESSDSILDNDRKAGKAKAFIREIMEICKKHNMVILPDTYMEVHSAYSNPIPEHLIPGVVLEVMEEHLIGNINVNNINL